MDKEQLIDNRFQVLVEECINGKRVAQYALYEKYHSYCKIICLRYTQNETEAEDVLNESFLKVFSNLHTYDLKLPFKAWIRKIIINTAISNYRKYRSENRLKIPLHEVPMLVSDHDLIGLITADEILKLVHRMKPTYKRVFLLHVIEGYKHKEIAEIMQISEWTVRSTYVRAKQRMKILVVNHYPR